MNQKKAGVILSYLSELIKVISSLLYTPIMLRILGKNEYGLYQLVYSVVSYLGLLSLGFTSAYVKFFSKYNAKDDQKNINKLNGMFMTIFIVISAVSVICGMIMIYNIKWVFSTGLTELEYSKAKYLMALMILNLALTFPNSVFNCITSAYERFFFQKLMNLIHSIVNPFLSLALLLLDYGSIGLIFVTTFLTITSLITNVVYCKTKLKIKFDYKKFDFSLLKTIWRFTFFIFLNQIIDQINLGVDKYLLGRMIGTSAVAIYGVGSHIHILYISLSSCISNVFVPRINQIVAKTNDNKELSEIFIKVGRIQFIILSFIISGFIIFGSKFILFWAGEEYKESFYIALILMLPSTIPLIQNLGIEIQRAKNKHQVRSIVYFCIAIANICLSIPLISLLGPIGATIGTAISLFAGNIIFMNWYYYRRIGIDIPLFWFNICSILPALILPTIMGVILLLTFPINSIGTLILQIVLYSICFCISMIRFGLNEWEKNIIYGSINRIKKVFYK